MDRMMRVAALGLLALVAVACGGASANLEPPAQPAVDRTAAIEIAHNAMASFEAGDYATWARDWSPAMKAAIKEAEFQAFRSHVLEAFGHFVSMGEPTLSKHTVESYRWTFPITFERRSGSIWFAFKGDSKLVEGNRVE